MREFQISHNTAPPSGFAVGNPTGSLYMWSDVVERWIAIVGKNGIVNGRQYPSDHLDPMHDTMLPVGAKIVITT